MKAKCTWRAKVSCEPARFFTGKLVKFVEAHEDEKGAKVDAHWEAKKWNSAGPHPVLVGQGVC